MREVTQDQLLNEVKDKWDRRARFITMTCVDNIDHFDLIYSFDHNLDMENFRVRAAKEQPFPSISGIYYCAFLIENEIQDHFGMKFSDLVPNFEGLLILSKDAPHAPMLRKTEKDERGRNEDAV
ncbi:MAG: NADH-quinone oxidoreductase subunit C [Acidobacteriota bacterium]